MKEHANSLRLGTAGILIIGESGAGKSSITLALLERAGFSGRSACLIADDFCEISVCDGRLIASPVPNLSGIIEVRGAGLFTIPFEQEVQLNYVFELSGHGERYPSGKTYEVHNISLPLFTLPNVQKGDALFICQAIEACIFGKKFEG